MRASGRMVSVMPGSKRLEPWLDLAQRAASGTDRVLLESAFTKRLATFEAERGATARVDLLRALLSALVAANESQIDGLNLPEGVRALIRGEFERIDETTQTGDNRYFDLSVQPTRCDFRIVCFGRIPVGFEHIEIGGVPRSVLWRGGLAQACRFMRLLAGMKGVKPMYQAHLGHRIRQSHFLLVCNREAQIRQYKNIADCLKINPQYHGFMAVSWYYDPQLETVSPYLVFLREFPVDHGAKLFRYGLPDTGDGGALSKSHDRQKAHLEGKYTPVEYLIIWPRDSLISWADHV